MLYWCQRAGISQRDSCRLLGLREERFSRWRHKRVFQRKRPGRTLHKLLPEEREQIVDFRKQNPEGGYRMIHAQLVDAGIVYVSPCTVYRVLSSAELLLERAKPGTRAKKSGFVQPKEVHEHWHTDFTYLKIEGVQNYLFTVIDGYSRVLLAWGLFTDATEAQAQIVIERAREQMKATPKRIISDNGGQYTSDETTLYFHNNEIQHVRTSPNYPQSNGKQERYYKTFKEATLKRITRSTRKEALEAIEKHMYEYNNVRLHSTIGYVTPMQKLRGEEPAITARRKALAREAAASRALINQQRMYIN